MVVSLLATLRVAVTKMPGQSNLKERLDSISNRMQSTLLGKVWYVQCKDHWAHCICGQQTEHEQSVGPSDTLPLSSLYLPNLPQFS